MVEQEDKVSAGRKGSNFLVRSQVNQINSPMSGLIRFKTHYLGNSNGCLFYLIYIEFKDTFQMSCSYLQQE